MFTAASILIGGEVVLALFVFIILFAMAMIGWTSESGKAKKLEIKNAELKVEVRILRKLMVGANVEKLLAEDPLLEEFQALEAERKSKQDQK